MCASPGSKSTHLAQLMGNEGTLILIDKNRNRILALETNLRRMRINNSIVLNMDSIYLSKIRVSADKILLDAPCTGEGLIRQDASRKKSKKMRDLEKMASIQKKLLIAGLNALKKGGKLFYCTCSIAPEENELVLNDVLHDKSDFSIERINNQYDINGYIHICRVPLLEDLKFSQRLYPHLHDTIGFFFCLIQRKNRGSS